MKGNSKINVQVTPKKSFSNRKDDSRLDHSPGCSCDVSYSLAGQVFAEVYWLCSEVLLLCHSTHSLHGAVASRRCFSLFLCEFSSDTQTPRNVAVVSQ